MLTVALRLAGLGWRVHPLRPNEKHPLTMRGCLDATTDAEKIGSWWSRTPDANIGVATGAGSVLVVIDIDGPLGRGSWSMLTRGHDLPDTLEQQTGRDLGGSQLLWQHPGGTVKNRTALAPGVDVRGDGGYIVVPPSRHPTGRRYRWSRRMPPAPMPPWLVALVQPRARAVSLPPPRPRDGAGRGAYGLAALDAAYADVAALGQGSRALGVFHHASSIGELVAGGELGRETAEARLTMAALACGLPEREATRQVRCGLEAGARTPRGAPR